MRADEADPLLVVEDAKPLTDAWEGCAASYAKARLSTKLSPESVADQALRHCEPKAAKLSRFLTTRVGRKSAGNVMLLLREKYRSGLVAAIKEREGRR
jgi:hypothetical protein